MSSRPAEPRELIGEAVRLVPLRPDHVGPLVAILREPAVACRWPTVDDRDREEVFASESGVTGFAILAPPDVETAVVGYLQASEELTPDYRHAGIDLFLATDQQGRGLGPDAIRTAIRWLIADRGHHRITIDPAADNASAIRAYEKVGFRPVGVLRRYERGADGSWHDGLLMELLADELR